MDIVNVPEAQIEFRRKVGKHDRSDLWHYKLVGGLHMIVKADARGTRKTLGMAPHPAVAQHLAEKMVPGNIQWTGLDKSEALPLEAIEPLVPKYMEMTLRMQQLEKAWPTDEESKQNEAQHHVINDMLYEKGAKAIPGRAPKTIPIKTRRTLEFQEAMDEAENHNKIMNTKGVPQFKVGQHVVCNHSAHPNEPCAFPHANAIGRISSHEPYLNDKEHAYTVDWPSRDRGHFHNDIHNQSELKLLPRLGSGR